MQETEKKAEDIKNVQEKADSADDLMKPPATTKVLKSARKSENHCDVCNITFTNYWHLTYHIRQNHFNLKAKIPQREAKSINQVWFEKVLNSDNIVEIKKTGRNRLVMRKFECNKDLRVVDINIKDVDLTYLYPVQNQVDNETNSNRSKQQEGGEKESGNIE